MVRSFIYSLLLNVLRSIERPFLVNETVTISCSASRSSYHQGQVKFLLFINRERVDSTSVRFDKDGKSTVEAALSFLATKDRLGSNSATHKNFPIESVSPSLNKPTPPTAHTDSFRRHERPSYMLGHSSSFFILYF